MKSHLSTCLLFLFLSISVTVTANAVEADRPPENVHKGEMAAYPSQWSFNLPKHSLILTSDQDLEILSSDPDKVIDLSLTFDKDMGSLRSRCEAAKKSGARTLIVAFDHFFQQYRPGQNHQRTLMPDQDEYIEKIAKISKFAEGYGLGLELSLLTPLEIGLAYREETGESGYWMQYRKGLRDPKTGAYSVSFWRQTRWTNNKGPFQIEDAGVRVFAFCESPIFGTPYRAVSEDAIVEITDDVNVETLGSPDSRYHGVRVRVHGKGKLEQEGLNRVLVIQKYRTPEMDYYSDNAKKYLKKLVDRYANAGIKLNALYSDEPHLMGDWDYHNHHEHGQFALRYVSPGFADRFAKTYGEKYRDFAKYLVYFTYGQEDFSHTLSATQGIMHTFGASPTEIRETALFRSRYYKLLQDGLADLLIDAKHHAERRMGHRLESRAHATWAESPTIDYWVPAEGIQNNQVKYEYTSDFLWSNTVQQSAVACSDYFAWGDFLTGSGNDHAEGGWLDRNYFGLALACSTGSINEIPFSYGAHWGMPGPISHRRHLVGQTFGALQWHATDVQDFEHRAVDVLMLYPIDLVAVDERFGSWMNQYAYCNYITQPKLLELGTVKNGAIEMAGRRYSTLVAAFEPFPSPKLLSMAEQLVREGGRVVWSGPVPVLTDEGTDALAAWSNLFGVTYHPMHTEGMPQPGRQVVFEGTLQKVSPQIILTDFLVDHVYPIADAKETEVVAKVGQRVTGTRRAFPGGGSATYLGFRPRDDQSCSLGYDVRTWFEILNALGAYPASGRFDGVNDNTEFLSRTGEYIVCRFPNGTVSLAPHLKNLEENWEGGFARNRERDNKIMERITLPSNKISLDAFCVNGHKVDYDGVETLSFRADNDGNLLGFFGQGVKEITIDGKKTVFSENPLGLLMFSPLHPSRRVEGGAIFEMMVHGSGEVRIPFTLTDKPVKIFTQGATLGSRGKEIESRRDGNVLVLNVTPESSGPLLWVVPQE